MGYGSRLSEGSEEGLKRDSTGEAYLTISYRPAKNIRGKVAALVVLEDVG